MFIIKTDIKEEKTLIIGFYNNTFKITILKTLKIILNYIQNINFDRYNKKKKLYI
jgi:hypothetical protein